MTRFLKPISLIAIFSLFVLTGQGCFNPGGSSSQPLPQVTLEYWRVFDDEDTFDPVIDAYRAQHPNVRINYRKLRFDEYEDELIQAFAEGRGPDIFSVHNTWMREYQNLMMPMPPTVTILQQEQRGTVRKEVVTTAVEKQTMSMKSLNEQFIETVPEDVVLSYQPDPSVTAQDRIYGLPLSVDTLALFYNKDLLDAAGIATPPKTWTDFLANVEALTVTNQAGDIVQSGAAMGTANNVERVADILSLLMLQTGTPMTDARGRIAFNSIPADAAEGVFPALDAVNFYTNFANPISSAYTWNSDFPNSFEAFANGETAFFLGYSYHTPLIRTTAPRLNFAVAPAPQIADSREVNYANYWVEGVSAQTDYEDWAWDFLLFATSQEQVSSHLDLANKPTALRALRSTQLDDIDVGPFARQLLTAETWYRGRNVQAAEQAFKDLVTNILEGRFEDPEDALDLAADKVSQTF